MSGGSFDYNCFRISQFADELELKIRSNDDEGMDEYGDSNGADYTSDTMIRLKVSLRLIRAAGNIAKEIEWLYSGDIGEESFVATFDEIWASGLGENNEQNKTEK